MEEIYSSKVLDISDKRIVKETGYKTWIKIMKHRWYSIYEMNILEEIKTVDNPEEAAEKIVPLIFKFIENTDSLLQNRVGGPH